MDGNMDAREFSQFQLSGNSATDLGLTLSPGSPQLSNFQASQQVNAFDPNFDFDVAIDLAALGNTDWAFDGFQGPKKRGSDVAFPANSAPSALKKQHVEIDQQQTTNTSCDLNNIDALFCEPTALGGDSAHSAASVHDATANPIARNNSLPTTPLGSQTSQLATMPNNTFGPPDSNVSSHALQTFSYPTAPASCKAKNKFAVGQQDIMNNHAGEVIRRAGLKANHATPYTSTGYFPSAPAQHPRVIAVNPGNLHGHLLNLNRRLGEITSERDMYKKTLQKFMALDEGTGQPAHKVLEGHLATARRTLSTTQRKLREKNEELEQSKKQYEALGLKFNELLTDFHRLLNHVRQITPESQPGDHQPMRGMGNAQLPATISVSSTQASPTAESPPPSICVQMSAAPVSNGAGIFPSLSGNHQTGRAQQTPAHTPATPVTPQATALVDLTSDSDESPVSALMTQSPASALAPAPAPVNKIAEFRRSFRNKDFKWLHQQESTSETIIRDTNKKNKTAEPKNAIAALNDDDMDIGTQYTLNHTQKVIRKELGSPFWSSEDEAIATRTTSSKSPSSKTASSPAAPNATVANPTVHSRFVNTSSQPGPNATEASPISIQANTYPKDTYVATNDVDCGAKVHLSDEEICRLLEEEMRRED
ncbi:hypothetical protein N7474_008054 [Penicillium riverlandense]|uniref:uncharacterized protein n=1 Tax=Penicillium riverlandense TaxID=1903569 RepID=UPI00254812D3|nr:uncharacterized protein N7474_008054 [Penicillium riverlandense]KAJ5811753.1 hypothetical protein N7474_008054 [Penicillium riverlandense]